MVIVADQPISSELRDRFVSTRIDRPPSSPADPRTLLDDRPSAAPDWFERDRDRAAHMLFHLDDPGRVLDLGLDHLVRAIGTARGDAGLIDRSEARYHPVTVVADPCEADAIADVAATPLPNHHPVLQHAWAASGATGFDRVVGNRALGTLVPVFERLGTTAMLASSIRHGGVGLGLLCIDEVDGERRWRDGERRRVDDFITRWLAPILHASIERSTRPRLSPAESDAVALLAQGLTYAEIGRRLGKSARTVDNQLRSARRKLGARNGMELVRAFERSNPAI